MLSLVGSRLLLLDHERAYLCWPHLCQLRRRLQSRLIVIPLLRSLPNLIQMVLVGLRHQQLLQLRARPRRWLHMSERRRERALAIECVDVVVRGLLLSLYLVAVQVL